MPNVRLIGRSASHFTRVAAIFAHELDVAFELVVVPDLSSLDAAAYAGHPGLKIPALSVDGEVLFGTENVCRRLAELSPRRDLSIVWPHELPSTVTRNAMELVAHAMAAEVTLVLAPGLGRVGRDNPFVTKVTRGLEGSLAWLDGALDEALAALPSGGLSYLEVMLFCLASHVAFRRTVPLEPYPRLRAFVAERASRPSHAKTAYSYDGPRAPPGATPRLPPRPPALDPNTVPPRTTSAYPEVFRELVLPREKRALGDALGLTRVGVNLTTLHPGRQSSLRHHHTPEDELVFVLEGEVVLRTDEGDQVLGPGACAGFPAGAANAHQLVNRTDEPARYLEVGTRDPSDRVVYTDVDLAATRSEGSAWAFTRKSGAPY